MCWSFPTTLSAIPWRTGRYSHRIHTKVLGVSFIFQLQLWVLQSCFSQLWTIWGWVFWMTPTYCPHKSKTFGFRSLNVSAAETITKTHKRVWNWCATESWFINPWQSYILVKERKQRRAVNLRSSTNWFGRLGPKVLWRLGVRRTYLPLRYMLFLVMTSNLPMLSELIWHISQGPETPLVGLTYFIWCMHLILRWLQPLLAMFFSLELSTRLWKMKNISKPPRILLSILLSPIQSLGAGCVFASMEFAVLFCGDSSWVPLVPFLLGFLLNFILRVCWDTSELWLSIWYSYKAFFMPICFTFSNFHFENFF